MRIHTLYSTSWKQSEGLPRSVHIGSTYLCMSCDLGWHREFHFYRVSWIQAQKLSTIMNSYQTRHREECQVCVLWSWGTGCNIVRTELTTLGTLLCQRNWQQKFPVGFFSPCTAKISLFPICHQFSVTLTSVCVGFLYSDRMEKNLMSLSFQIYSLTLLGALWATFYFTT